jgi:O-antigen/teichoic acid export membrane protein
MSRGRRLITSSLFGVIDLILQIGISFLMMPFLIHSLGDKQYGLWILVATFMGYYGLLDLGLSSAVSRFISRAIGHNDKNERNIIISTSFYIFLLLGLIALIVTLLCIFFAYVIISSKDDLYTFRILLLIMGISLCLTFPLRAFAGVIAANLYHYISRLINIVITIIRTLLVVYVIIAGYGLIGIATVTAMCSILSGICLIFFAFRIEDAISISPSFFRKNRVKELFGYSVYVFVGRVADILKYSVDSFVIAKFVSLGAVTHYGIALRLCDYFIKLIATIVSVTTPVFSQEEGKGDLDSIRKKFLFTTKISTYLSMFVGFMILLYGKPFIARWMGNEYLDSYPVLFLLIIPSIIGMSQTPSSNVLYGISKHQIIAHVNIGEGVSNLILSLILVQYYGIFGVALGTAIPQATTTIMIYPYYICKTLKISLYRYSKEIVKCLLISSLSLMIVRYAFNASIRPDYPTIIILCFFQSVICCSAIIILGFSAAERMYLLNFMRKR